jgi:hypothetical protein
LESERKVGASGDSAEKRPYRSEMKWKNMEEVRRHGKKLHGSISALRHR